MDPETPFWTAVIVVVIGSAGTSGYHRIQAAKSRERISRKGEGLALFLAIRLSGAALLVATLLYLTDSHGYAWSRLPLSEPVRWSGAALGVATIGMLYWTLSTLGKNLTDTVMTRANATLVTGGPYRWIRHPFYVSMVLLVLSTALLSASWLVAVSGAVLFLFLAIRAPIEEQKLVERFGDEYRDYMRRTARYVPGLW